MMNADRTFNLSEGMDSTTRFIMECSNEWMFTLSTLDTFDPVSHTPFELQELDPQQSANLMALPKDAQTDTANGVRSFAQHPPSPPLSTTQPSTGFCDPDHSNSLTKHPNRKRRSELEENDGERQRLLERNRVAASKCRQKKKKWMQELEEQSEQVSAINKQLRDTVSKLREESIFLRNQLLTHNNCDCTLVQTYLRRTSAQLVNAYFNHHDPTLANNARRKLDCNSEQSLESLPDCAQSDA